MASTLAPQESEVGLSSLATDSPTPTWQRAVNTTRLSAMAADTCASASTTTSFHSTEPFTTARGPTRTPGDNTLFSTVPSITQPAEISELTMRAPGKQRAGGGGDARPAIRLDCTSQAAMSIAGAAPSTSWWKA